MKTSFPGKVKPEYVILGLITVMAGLLRFYKLGTWSYWIDELYTLNSAIKPYSENLYRPFWLITRLGLDLFGENAFSLRVFPAVFGVLAIPILYFPIKAMFNKRVSLVAMSFLAITPWHIYLSQLSRWYSILLLASSLSLLLFYFYIETTKTMYLVGYLLLFGFAFSLHLTAGFVIIISISYLICIALFKKLRPSGLSAKKLNWFLAVVGVLALLLAPKFLAFVQHWNLIQQEMGYWGSTPLNFTLKVLYHLTPTFGVVSAAGLILFLTQPDRKGVFLVLYCVLPVLLLNLAALFETNVSAKYVFFILPGLLTAISYLVFYIFDNVNLNKNIIVFAVIGALILPALQTDYTYFTTDHGNRNRLQEAVSYLKERSHKDDAILPLYFFANPIEGKFYLQMIADLAGFRIHDDNYIFPDEPEQIDSTARIWILTIGKQIRSDASGMYKWIAESARLVAEFEARRGPDDNSVRVYLAEPKQIKYQSLNK